MATTCVFPVPLCTASLNCMQATEQSMRNSLASLQSQLQSLQAATLAAALAAQSSFPCARINGEGQYYFQVWTQC